MRQRINRWRPRSMARRPDGDDRFSLSPRARRIAGWLAALLLVLGIAAVVRFLGGNGDGTPVGAAPSGSASPASDAAAITFGTAIDPATGQVAEAARAESFTAGETFAYSVEPGAALADPVYVEVRRTGGGPVGVVQEAVDDQDLPDPRAIAFTVPVDNLLDVFGSGEYLMLIYAEAGGTGDPLAEGTFELVSAAPGSPVPSTSASASP
ncbi:MAG TPA: hypothetical protein VFN76_00790 [Candidatus Limnocylindria bacterium]|nr:hypothetical protein [Candidatus Limnocylindria bacterium]